MSEGKETITLKGSLVLLKGYIPEVGEIAPDFTYVQADMVEKSLYDLEGLNKIIISMPSVDTGICALTPGGFGPAPAAPAAGRHILLR